MVNVNKLQKDFNDVSTELYIVNNELKAARACVGVYTIIFIIVI